MQKNTMSITLFEREKGKRRERKGGRQWKKDFNIFLI